MDLITLGKTGLTVNKNGFGALPIQRIAPKDAAYLLQKAFYHGVNYFDTARGYTDSEEKIGLALSHVRDRLIISTKTTATSAEDFWTDLHTSLKLLKTDYVDLYQFHNPAFCPKPGHSAGLYEAMQQAVQQGKVRHIGITNHRPMVAKEAVESGLYETLQFPFSYLASQEDELLVQACKGAAMGFIAMKGLGGGLITSAAAAYAYLNQYDWVSPIWGIQRETELDEFLSFQQTPPQLDQALWAIIQKDRETLAGEFCRGCGYCMPCPAGISIGDCARMSLMIRRAPAQLWLTEHWQQEMQKIEGCLHCGQCKKKCPYGLDTPTLLEKNYTDYKTFIK